MKMSLIVSLLMVTGLVTFAGWAQTKLTVTGESSRSDIPQTAHGRIELWRQDLQHLAKELPRRHKNAFHTVSREAYDRAVAELDAAIPTLQEPEIIVGIQQILSLVGDGHTFLTGFPARTSRRYPLSLFWFGDELRVLRTSADYRQVLGARVTRIGELSLAEATSKVSRIISTDNEYWTRHISALFLTAPEILFTLKILPTLERGQWTFEDAKGQSFSVEMTAIAAEEKVEWLLAAKEAPLYRRRAGERFWFSSLAEAQTVYVNLRGYPDTDDFKRSADELLKLIDVAKPKRLVLDVRQNEGGDLKKGRYLLAGLKKRNVFTARDRVYVIIGRATNSAAMANAIDFRNELNALLVGEPTGGRPNSYSENEYFFLPNSKLKISYSTKYHKFQDADTPALMPDKRIEPAWESYQAGRDAALEWILATFGEAPNHAKREANLSHHPSADRDPAWSPDGKRIAFVSDRDGNFEIYVMNADGSQPTPLTKHAHRDAWSRWAPDGKRLAFFSRRDSNDDNDEIYVMNADGGAVKRLTENRGLDFCPDWSADGKLLAFVSIREDAQMYIYRMNADGSGLERVTSKPDRVSTPSWSPAGDRIAFSLQRDGNFEIYVVEHKQ